MNGLIAVAVNGKAGVGAVLAGWMNRLDINPTTLARASQLSRATIYVVLDSRSRNPGTMRQLARGLSKRYSDQAEGDPEVERAALRDLLAAIDYGHVLDDRPPALERATTATDGYSVEDEVRDILATIPGAQIAMTNLARGLRFAGEEDQRFVVDQLKALARRFGKPSKPADSE